jgi:hypothetical protein
MCAALVCLLAAVTLVEHFAPTGLSFDQQLLSWLGSVGESPPRGRMAPASAVEFLMLGGALLALDARRVAKFAELLTVVPLLVGLLALTGDVLSFQLAPERGNVRRSPFPAVTTFLLLAVGILHARPERGWMAVIMSDRLGGVLARLLLPIALLVPFLLGMFRVVAPKFGLDGAGLGLPIYVLANMIVLMVFVVWYAAALNRLDTTRSRSEERYRAAVQTALD